MGYLKIQIGNQAAGLDNGPGNLARIDKTSQGNQNKAQQLNVPVKRSNGKNVQIPRFAAVGLKNNQTLAEQILKPRSPAVKTPAANQSKVETSNQVSIGYSNTGKFGVSAAQTNEVNGWKQINGATVEFAGGRIGGSVSRTEEFVGKINRSSKTAIGYDVGAGSSYVSHEQKITADVGNGGKATATIGLKGDGKTGVNPIGIIGFQQPLSSTLSVSAQAETPGDGTFNVSLAAKQQFGDTSLGVKVTQPLRGGANLEANLGQNVGPVRIGVSADTNGELKAQFGVNIIQ